jgi:hypothetical protein
MLALLLALAFQSAPLPSIDVKSDGKGGWLFTVGTFAVADADAVNARLDVLAQEKCGKLKPRWGKYSMRRVPAGTGGVKVDSFADYRQAIWCIDPGSDPHQPAPKGWTADSTDDADARAFTGRYLEAIDSGDPAAVRALYSPSLSDATGPEELRATVTKFRTITSPQSRRVTQVHWWLNPDFAPYPGIFVAVGFEGPQHCGYILWYRESPGNYSLVRQEVFGKPLQFRLTATERADLDRICKQL